jgi:hypothetical protein
MDKSRTAEYKSKDYSNFNLKFPEVELLLDQIEMIKRRKIRDSDEVINYIDPLNHVKTLKNPVNHLIIGRRGAGKTSLLIKVIEEIKKTGGFITTVDMQSKQRLSADLPLVEVLLKLYTELLLNIESNQTWEPYIKRKSKIKFYKLKSLYFGLIKKELWTNDFVKFDTLHFSIINIIGQLEQIKKTPDGASLKTSEVDTKKRSKISNLKVSSTISADTKYLEIVNAQAYIKANYSIVSEEEKLQNKTTEFIVSYSKKEALDILKTEIVECLENFHNLIKIPIHLILDDFYQIPINNQPYIFQYLHDLNKETSKKVFSFKACLVPHRFKLNEISNKILSHKDDFSTINLDRDFYELEDNKDLLFKILCGIDPSLGFTSVRIHKLFNDQVVLNNCIRASGALPRYFLDVFSNMVKYSLAENQTKIHKMVLSMVIRKIKQSKDELIIEEAYLPEMQIRKLYRIIEEEVVHGLRTNIVLYPYESFKDNEGILNSLINLGYLHRVKEKIVVEKSNYVPLFIDMVFTHTQSEKMPTGFRDVKFWTKNGKELKESPKWKFNKSQLETIECLNLN